MHNILPPDSYPYVHVKSIGIPTFEGPDRPERGMKSDAALTVGKNYEKFHLNSSPLPSRQGRTEINWFPERQIENFRHGLNDGKGDLGNQPPQHQTAKTHYPMSKGIVLNPNQHMAMVPQRATFEKYNDTYKPACNSTYV